jgi:hypothetical protein
MLTESPLPMCCNKYVVIVPPAVHTNVQVSVQSTCFARCWHQQLLASP